MTAAFVVLSVIADIGILRLSWLLVDAAFRARDSAVRQLAEESARRTELQKQLRARQPQPL